MLRNNNSTTLARTARRDFRNKLESDCMLDAGRSSAKHLANENKKALFIPSSPRAHGQHAHDYQT
jgi:hypothetical protein